MFLVHNSSTGELACVYFLRGLFKTVGIGTWAACALNWKMEHSHTFAV